MTTPTPAWPPLPTDLDRDSRRLRLPYLRRHAPEVLARAKAQRWDPAKLLRALLAEEASGRDVATRNSRRRAAWPLRVRRCLMGRGGVIDSRTHPVGAGHPRVARPRGEPGGLRPVRHRQVPPRRSARPCRHRQRNAGVVGHAGVLTATIGRAKADASIARTLARITRRRPRRG